jgi:hypothetical protein
LFDAEINSLDSNENGFYSDYDNIDCDNDDSESDEMSNHDFDSVLSPITFEDFKDSDTLNLQLSEEKAFFAGKTTSLFQNYPSSPAADCNFYEEELEENRRQLRLERMKASKHEKMRIAKELNSAVRINDEEQINSLIVSHITSTRCCKRECFLQLCQGVLNFSYPVEVIKYCRDKVRNCKTNSKRDTVREQLKLSNIKHSVDTNDNCQNGTI